MTDPVADLLAILTLETTGPDRFRGVGHGGETPTRIFGGHVVAQALAAAQRSVDARPCHALHAFFLRPGDTAQPVDYAVERLRDGGSFTTRRVTARQAGAEIFTLTASFHGAEPGPTHQRPMPPAPDPDTLTDRPALRAAYARRLPPMRRAAFLRASAIEVREVEPYDLTDPTPASDAHAVWLRLAGPAPDDDATQRCLLAYASDLKLLGAAMRPHGESWMTGRTMTASLDHSVWFHAPPDLRDWHLYAMGSPWAGGGRGFNRGALYAADGRLVASTAQEGLIRPVRR